MSQLRHRSRLAVVAACTIAMLATAAPAPAATSAPDVTAKIGLFCACWGGGPTTEDQWAAAAANMSVMVGGGSLGKRVSYLHGRNAALLALVYNLGPYTTKNSPLFTDPSKEAWFAHDAQGKRIYLPMFPSNYVMEMSNPDWLSYWAGTVKAQIAKSGFDGAMIDSMGPAITGTYGTGKPVRPGTTTPYTAAEWVQLGARALNTIKATIGSSYLLFNGLISGSQYASATKPLIDSNANGGVAEGFVRQAASPINTYPTVAKWLAEVEMLRDVEAKGKNLFGWTKTWVTANTDQMRDWDRFATATYLLAKRSSTSKSTGSYLDFNPSRSWVRSAVFDASIQQAALGAALGDMTVLNGIYTRLFEHGTVSVNPGAHTASITVTP